MSLTLAKKICTVPSLHNRTFFHWINIIFNTIDEDRRKIVGPDRSCAEWLLRNGATVKWVGSKRYVTDYNTLPKDDGPTYHIQEVDASNSSIMHYGFGHFEGCDHIKKIIFHQCKYLEDSALEELTILKKCLLYLQVSSCHNITTQGLSHLSGLTNLQNLLMFDLPYVVEKDSLLEKLHKELPKCNIQYNYES